MKTNKVILALATIAALSGTSATAQTHDANRCGDYLQLTLALPQARSNLPALRLLGPLIPQACTREREMLNDLIRQIESQPEWQRANSEGVLEPVTPPPPPSWAQDREMWPRYVRADEMLATPTQQQLDRLHPPRALDRERSGAVSLEGRILANGGLAWRVLGATPHAWGFEAAALKAAAYYRAPLTFPDGRTTVGTTFYAVIGFTRQPHVIYYDQ